MTYIKNIDEALAFISREHASLLSKLDQTIPTIQKLESYPKLPALFQYGLESVSNNGEYHSSLYYKPHNCQTTESVETRRDALLAVCDSTIVMLEETRNKNVVIIERNKKVREKVGEFMKVVGIAPSYSAPDPKSRARIPKSITHSSGYIKDLERCVPINDYAYNNIIKSIQIKREQITTWASKAIASIREQERIKTQEENQKKQDMLLSVLKIKFNLPYDSDKNDVLDALLDKSKYLRLAHTMLRCREDFSLYYLVEDALDSFPITNINDDEIYEDISTCLKNWDGDGRIFRDTKCNYNTLFDLVSQDLLDDYNSLRQFMDL